MKFKYYHLKYTRKLDGCKSDVKGFKDYKSEHPLVSVGEEIEVGEGG